MRFEFGVGDYLLLCVFLLEVVRLVVCLIKSIVVMDRILSGCYRDEFMIFIGDIYKEFC